MDLNALLGQLRQRACLDPAFRQEFELNPLGVLERETGLSAEQLRMLGAPMSADELAAIAGGIDTPAEGGPVPPDLIVKPM